MRIRPEAPQDVPAVRHINERAFGRRDEADLVDRLRLTCPEALSLVAEEAGEVVGHILFTPASIDTDRGPIVGMGLAPMAVLPERQRRGVGAALVEHGLDLLRTRACPFVIVLGHPGYYPRFGFEIASRLGLVCQWEDVPGEAFMALVYDAAVMDGVAGEVRYRPEFDAAP